MQKVAWPITIVISDGVSEKYSIADSSAKPVMMPGSAIGSTSSSDSEFLPKKLKRPSAKAAAPPSTIDTSVAASPTLNELISAVWARVSWMASDHQWVE